MSAGDQEESPLGAISAAGRLSLFKEFFDQRQYGLTGDDSSLNSFGRRLCFGTQLANFLSNFIQEAHHELSFAYFGGLAVRSALRLVWPTTPAGIIGSPASLLI